MRTPDLEPSTVRLLALLAGVVLGSVGCHDPGADSMGIEGDKAEAPHGLLIRWRGGADPKAGDIHARLGGRVVRRYASVPGLQFVELAPGRDLFDTVAAYGAQPEVAYAEPNWRVGIALEPSDPGFEHLWALHNEGQTGGVADADLDAPQAWDLVTGGGAGAIVVIDTGVDHGHEDLAANLGTNPGEIPDNGVDDDDNGYVDDVHGLNAIDGTGDPMDDHGHGTHVAGTIGAVGDNATGVVGVSWDAELLACKFISADSQGTLAGALACLDWTHQLATRASDPVDVLATNNSWGGSPYSQALADAIQAQQQAGILFVAAAGNAGVDLDATPTYPASYFAPNLLTVAATDDADLVPDFSNTGSHRVHLGAPGVGIVSTVPGDAYATYSGTSMAAPQVTGLLGLLRAQDPGRPWYELRNLVLAGGTPTDALAGATLTGRRLRAADASGQGSLTCSDQALTARMRPVGGAIERRIGDVVDVQALHIDCAQGLGPASTTLAGGSLPSFTLQDDGSGVDDLGGDGISAGAWQVAPGLQTITLPGGDELAITGRRMYRPATTVAYAPRTIDGTALELADDGMATVTPPFPIPFGGADPGYGSLVVAMNGTVQFTTDVGDWRNRTLPDPSLGAAAVPLWDDWYPVAGSAVRWDVVGVEPERELVVEWRDVGHVACPDPSYTWQVVFHEADPAVEVHYVDLEGGCVDHGSTATVGAQMSAQLGEQTSYYAPAIASQSALRYELQAGTAPTLDPVAFGASSVQEGDAVAVSSSFDDPDTGPWAVDWAFSWPGDFRPERTQAASAPGAIEAETTFAQDGPATVAVRVTDSHGYFDMGSGSIEVANAVPVVETPAVVEGAVEGSPVTLGSSFADPGLLDAPWRAEWDLDASTDPAQFAVDASKRLDRQGAIEVVAPALADQGSFRVAVRVWDEVSGDAPAVSDPASVLVEVQDVDPVIASAGVAATDGSNEPVWARLEAEVASGAADPEADPLDRFEWDFDADGTADAVTSDPVVEHVFEDGPASGERTVRLVAWDEDSSSEAAIQVAVANVAPAIDPIDDGAAIEGSLFTQTLTAADPGDVPVWTLLDGPEGMALSSVGVLEWTPTSAQCGPDPGAAHQVAVEAADDDGGSDTASFTVSATCLDDGTTEPQPLGEVAIVAPESGAIVIDEDPALVVEPAVDPDSAVLSYEFEVHADAAMTSLVGAAVVGGGESEVEVVFDAGADDPAIDHQADLVDDADYWWRARATDGTLAGPWAEAVFRYDPVDDPPTAPTLASPLDGDSVATQTPELHIGGATDPDSEVRYDIAIYADADLSVVVDEAVSLAEGADGTTGWTVPAPLADNAWYWWQATAGDGTSRTGSAVGTFLVDLENEPPTAPDLIAPAVGAQVGSTVELGVANAQDPDGAPLDYLFELDTSRTFGSPSYQRTVREEGLGSTWATFEGLAEDTTWWWRVRAHDGSASGDWVRGDFFVNDANDPPTAPTALAPTGGAIATPGAVKLVAGPATDPEGDALVYTFAVHCGADAQEVASGRGHIGPEGTVAFTTPELGPGTSCTWTVAATDPQGATGRAAAGRFRTADLGYGCVTGPGGPPMPGFVLILLAGIAGRRCGTTYRPRASTSRSRNARTRGTCWRPGTVSVWTGGPSAA